MKNDATQGTADREITITRELDAPRELEFYPPTDHEIIANWWGPNGFTNTFELFEPRPGGEWRFVMHGPDGTEYKNKSVFVEISRPERIVFDHVSGHPFRVVATFEHEEKGTRLTFRMIFESEEECTRVSEFAVDANEENFDRLEVELAHAS